MRILKTTENSEFKEIHHFDNGVIVKVPRYKQMNILIGNKEVAKSMGLKVKGSNRLYFTQDGRAILNGHLAEERQDRELVICGKVKINNNNIQEFQELVKELLERK